METYTIVWIVQIAVFAIFDNRKSPLNNLLNLSIWGFSIYVTIKSIGWWWALVPLIALPLIGGAIGGIVSGLYIRGKGIKPNDSDNRHE